MVEQATAVKTSNIAPKRLALNGIDIRVLAGQKDTGGIYSLLHYTLPAQQMGAVPHVHRAMTEVFYVLSGELTVLEGEAWRTVRAGEFVSATPGVKHGFRNASDEPAVFLVFATPGGIENLLYELLDYAASLPSWPPSDPSRLIEMGLRHDSYYC